MKAVGFFDEVDPDQCGGKGRNLIALAAHHFPVPPAFVVTVDTHAQFESSQAMPEPIRQAISECYRRLVQTSGCTVVAVRSSASVEDSAKASFAGLFDTYLDIDGAHNVVEHVAKCWRSLHSKRSVLYQKMMKLPQDDLQMAVVVQTMLSPRSAGVVFTANPYTMDEAVMIVESSWGCGENVVSGMVTPDYFEISKNDGLDIIKKVPATKPAGDNAEAAFPEVDNGDKLRAACSIEDEQLKKLCTMAKEIESAFGGPQDIEWALEDDGSISILQSRPIARFGAW